MLIFLTPWFPLKPPPLKLSMDSLHPMETIAVGDLSLCLGIPVCLAAL